MKILIAKNIKPMGDFDQKFGQTYWGSVHDQEMPVMFNLMKQQNIGEGAKIQAEEYIIKESSKGTEYMRLRKVKVEGGAQVQTPPNDTMKLLGLMDKKIDEVLQRVKTLQGDIDDETAKEIFGDGEA